MRVFVFCTFLLALQVASQECPAETVLDVATNNPSFDGTCQVYKRGQKPCNQSELVESIGWFVVVGFGVFFSVLTVFIMQYETRKKGTALTSEFFSVGGRDLGTSMTASAIVAKWVWAASLLMSSNMGFSVGISGPFWYASGATIPILLFSMLAVQVKRRAAHAHTFLEIIKVRFGTVPHVIMIVFALTTNAIVTAMLILGGAGTIEDLTGMSKVTAAFLIPLVSCWIYALYGGLRASFYASYIHCSVIFFVVLICMFTVYSGGGEQRLWGSPSNVLNGLESATAYAFSEATKSETELKKNPSAAKYFDGLAPIMGNQGSCWKMDGGVAKTNLYKRCTFARVTESCCKTLDFTTLAAGSYCRSDTADCVSIGAAKHYESSGCDFSDNEVCVTSYATMASASGLVFGITNVVGNFGTVFVDQSYWQSAFAAKPRAAVRGFLIAGLVWFAVPFCMAGSTGLCARAMTTHPDIDGGMGAAYITTALSGAGLTPPRVLSHLIGSFGTFLLLLQLFMAITSTGCAEIMAVASILTYDVYFPYLNPELKLRREKMRRIFYSEIQAFVKSAPSDKDFTKTDLTVYPEREMAVRLEYAEQVVPEGQFQNFFDALVMAGFFEIIPNEAECKKLTELLAAHKSGVPAGILWSVMNKAMASTNIEGLVLLRMTRFFTGVFAIFMGFLTVLLLTMGLSLGHVYMSMGCIVGSAVGPVGVSILYEKANGKAIAAGAMGGFILAMISWVARAAHEFGSVEYAALMSDFPWVVGNVVAIVGGLTISLGGSVMFPDTKFKWSMLDDGIALVDDVLPSRDPVTESDAILQKDFKYTSVISIALSVFLVLIWPLFQATAGGIMGSASFGFWIAVVFIWGIVAAIVIIFFPLFEIYTGFSRKTSQTEVKEEVNKSGFGFGSIVKKQNVLTVRSRREIMHDEETRRREAAEEAERRQKLEIEEQERTRARAEMDKKEKADLKAGLEIAQKQKVDKMKRTQSNGSTGSTGSKQRKPGN